MQSPGTLRIVLACPDPDLAALARLLVERRLGTPDWTEVGDLPSLLRACDAGPPAVVLLDASLAWARPCELAEILSGRPNRPRILLLTDGSRLAEAAEAVRRGADDFVLSDPRGLMELPAKILAALERAAAPPPGREAALRALLTGSQIGLLHLDASGGLTDANPAAVGMFGLTASDEPRHFNIHAFGVRPVDWGLWLRQARENRETHLPAIEMRRLDGTVFPASLSLAWSGGAFCAVVQDMTERRRTERDAAVKLAELSRSNEELEQFARVAAHELQEPLRTITRFSALLSSEEGAALSESAKSYLDLVLGGGRRMGALVEDLLAYSRVRSRGERLEVTPAEESLGEALANLAGAIQGSGVRITHDPLPPVLADRRQLTSVFQNLIGNAIKFRGPSPPKVHISARTTQAEHTFSVRDEGIGMNPADCQRIFGLFQRLHPQGEYAGSGVGLSIAEKIIQRHGGRIWAESMPGRGSTFHFTLPNRAGSPGVNGTAAARLETPPHAGANPASLSTTHPTSHPLKARI